jgi:hypothetical protein
MPSLKPPLASGISDRPGTGGTGPVTQCPGRFKLLGGASHASTKPEAKVGGRHACLPLGAPRRGRGLTGRLLPPRDGLCGRRGEWPAPSACGPCRRDHGDAGELWRWRHTGRHWRWPALRLLGSQARRSGPRTQRHVEHAASRAHTAMAGPQTEQRWLIARIIACQSVQIRELE